MRDELVKNHVSIIELLLDSGFDIKSMDYDILGQLYNQVGFFLLFKFEFK